MSNSLTGRRRSFVAVQVTLTGGADRLLDLVNAVIAAETGMATPPMVCADACGHLVVQADLNTTSATILFGDALISSSRYGYQLAKGASQSYTSGNLNVIQFGSMYALGADGDLVNVEVMTY